MPTALSKKGGLAITEMKASDMRPGGGAVGGLGQIGGDDPGAVGKAVVR